MSKIRNTSFSDSTITSFPENSLTSGDQKTNSIAKEKFAQPLEIVYKKIRGVVSAILNPSKTITKTVATTKTYFNLLSAKLSAWKNDPFPLSSSVPPNIEEALNAENNKNPSSTTKNKEEPIIPSNSEPLDIENLLSRSKPDFKTFLSIYGNSDVKMLQAAMQYGQAFSKLTEEDIIKGIKNFEKPEEKIAFAVNLYRLSYALRGSKSWANVSNLKLILLNPQNEYLTREEKKEVLAQVNKLFP